MLVRHRRWALKYPSEGGQKLPPLWTKDGQTWQGRHVNVPKRSKRVQNSGLYNGQYKYLWPFDFCFKALWPKGPKGAPNDPKWLKTVLDYLGPLLIADKVANGHVWHFLVPEDHFWATLALAMVARFQNLVRAFKVLTTLQNLEIQTKWLN